jgi:predicted transcriptional regulator
VFTELNGCPARVAFRTRLEHSSDMVDLKLKVPVIEEAEVDAKTLAAIDRGAADADAGRVLSLEEVRKLVPQWISKFESQNVR